MFKKLLISFFSLLLAVLIFELFLKIKANGQSVRMNHFAKSRNSQLPYTYSPSQRIVWKKTLIETNSIGLRSRHEPEIKRSKCYRILIVGGSYSAGLGVSQSESYPELLEALLNSKSQSCYQVINAGQVAYDAKSTAAMLQEVFDKYLPHSIIFSLTPYAIDDPPVVNESGGRDGDFFKNISHNWLPLFWGLNHEFFDIKNPLHFFSWLEKEKIMGEKKRRLNNFKVYDFLRSRIARIEKFFSKPQKCISSWCLNLLPRYKNSQGREDYLPRYSPLYLSPFYQNKLYKALNEAIYFSAKKEVPLTFLSFDFFVDREKLANSRLNKVLEISQLLEVSQYDFFKHYNLGWDFHPNKEGHKKIAQGLFEFLKTPSSEGKYDYSIFQKANLKQRKAYEKLIFSHVSPSKKENIHQIISGIHPNTTSSKSSVLLKISDHKKLRVVGEFLDNGPRVFGIWVLGKSQNVYQAKAKTHDFDFEIPLSDFKNELVTVEIGCKKCGPIRYDFIGFEM